VRDVLKPEIAQMLDKKADLALFKKINFMGPSIACRLNVTPQILLEDLDGESVFSTLTQHVKNPWYVYWVDICKNGNDAEKWYKSLQQAVELDLVYVTMNCYRAMQQYGAYPVLHHYHLVMRHLAKFGFSYDVAIMFDDLDRCNERAKPTAETYGILIEMCIVQHQYQFIPNYLTFAKSKKITIDAELEKKAMELHNQWKDGAATLPWAAKLQPEGNDMPPRAKLEWETDVKNIKFMHDNLVKTYQPPIHLLNLEQ
jgi:hypothetical protein